MDDWFWETVTSIFETFSYWSGNHIKVASAHTLSDPVSKGSIETLLFSNLFKEKVALKLVLMFLELTIRKICPQWSDIHGEVKSLQNVWNTLSAEWVPGKDDITCEKINSYLGNPEMVTFCRFFSTEESIGSSQYVI